MAPGCKPLFRANDFNTRRHTQDASYSMLVTIFVSPEFKSWLCVEVGRYKGPRLEVAHVLYVYVYVWMQCTLSGLKCRQKRIVKRLGYYAVSSEVDELHVDYFYSYGLCSMV